MTTPTEELLTRIRAADDLVATEQVLIQQMSVLLAHMGKVHKAIGHLFLLQAALFAVLMLQFWTQG